MRGFKSKILSFFLIFSFIFSFLPTEIVFANVTAKESMFGGQNTAAITDVWIVPPGLQGGTVMVEAWGGGGAGGSATGNPASAGGGAGGQYAKDSNISVSTEGTSYAVQVAARPAASSNGVVNGQNSQWVGCTTQNTHVCAKGGAGGANSTGTSSAGGTGSTTGGIGGTGEGTTVYAGGSGGSGTASSNSGGGGGGAGSTGAGGAGSGVTAGTGTSVGGGDGGTGTNVANTKNNGSVAGGGGAGGRANTTTNRAGGNGGNGRVDISYTISDSYPAIVEVVAGQDTGNSTSHSITMPSGIVAGDLILVIFGSDGATGGTSSVNTGVSGNNWQELGDTLNGGTVAVQSAIYYKVAEGSDVLTITSSATQEASHIVYLIRNAGTPTASSAVSSVDGTNSDSPSHDAGATAELWIAARVGDASALTTSASDSPSGYSSLTNSSARTTGGAHTSASRRYTSTQTEDPGTFTSASEAWIAWTIAVPAPVVATTTLGDGTDPGATTIAPGASVTDLANFSLQTNTGADTVTALTVTLGVANSYENISKVEITDGSNVDECTDIDDPSSVTLNFTGCSLAVSTSATDFKIRVTPKTHANMPAVPGASYATTATVTSITATNSTAGTDTNSNAITIDNASPAGVTSSTATPGNTVVDLAWTNPGADFDEVVVLRHTSAVSDAPVEGTEYSVGNTIGSATVVCNTASTSCQDTSLSNGTAYHYKIFTQDTNGNYNAGTVPTGSPATPTVPATISQGASRVFENYDGASEFGTGGVVTGDASSTGHYGSKLASDGTYLYVTSRLTTIGWRIEKRRLYDGALCSAANCGTQFGTNGLIDESLASANAIPRDVRIDSTYMYIVGSDANSDWRIEKRRLSDGALCSAANCGTQFGTNGVVTGDSATNLAWRIVIDDTYMYVMGGDTNGDWRSEKRFLSTGALETNYGSGGVITHDSATYYNFGSMGLGLYNNNLYFVGSAGGSNYLRIEKRNIYDGSIVNDGFGTNGVLTGDSSMAEMQGDDFLVDPTGTYFFIVGSLSSAPKAQKRLLSDGSLVSSFGSGGVQALSAARGFGYKIDDTYMYVVGRNGSNDWTLEKRYLSDGSLVTEFGTSGLVTAAAGTDVAQDVLLDNVSMYAIGTDSNLKTRIEKRYKYDGSLFDATEPTVGPALSDWYSSAWSNRKKIIIDGGDVSGSTNMTNFPVLISLASDSDLASRAQDDADDIVFTSGDGLIKLDHEIESFDGSTGALVAWVEVPTLHAVLDTDIYMYYGNSTASSQENVTGVWDSSYQGVWHFPDGSTLSGNDSSSNAANATVNSGVAATAGKLGGGASFNGNDGADNNLDLDPSKFTSISTDITFSGWIKPNTGSLSTRRELLQRTDSASDNWWFNLQNSGLVSFYATNITGGVYKQSTNTVAENAWSHVAVTYNDATDIKIYINGSVDNTHVASGSFVTTSIRSNIGAAGTDDTKTFLGVLDEFRLSDSVRSPDWIATEYANQNSPSGFYSVDDEESYAVPSLTATSQAFRLRINIHAAGSQISQSGQAFKLQYAAKSGTCDAAFSGESYADISTGTPISFYDNSTLADGDNIIANLFDPSDGYTKVLQEYEEANNFTNAVAAIPADQDGVWDFALYDNGATQGASYCIRAVESDGTPLDSYTAVPEIAIQSPLLTQFGYIWRNDNDSETGADYLLDKNVPLNSGVYIGDNRRLRIGVSNTGAVTASGTTYRLEYSSGVCASWNTVPTSAGSDAWVMVSSGSVSNGAATTDSARLKNPANKTFVAGQLMTTASETGGITLTPTQFTEVEYNIEPTANVATDTTYCFRVTNAGNATGITYAEQPQAKAFAMQFISRGGGGGAVEAPDAPPGDQQGGGGVGDDGGGAGGEGEGGGQGQGGGGAGGGGGGDSGALPRQNLLASAGETSVIFSWGQFWNFIFGWSL